MKKNIFNAAQELLLLVPLNAVRGSKSTTSVRRRAQSGLKEFLFRLSLHFLPENLLLLTKAQMIQPVKS